MSVLLYMIGLVVFLTGLIWAAAAFGVPQLYIGIGALVLFGVGIFGVISRAGDQDL